MAGNVFYEIFYLIPKNPIPENPVLDLEENTLKSCCGDQSLKVLATTDTNDEYKNDKSGFIWWFDPVCNTAVLSLQKFVSGTWTTIATLNDSTYGTEYLYGFFTNVDGEKFVGYQLEWKNVLTINGEGGYRVICDVTTSIGGSGQRISPEYCLKAYTPSRANGTVRLEYFLNGISADVDFDDRRKNLGELNWYNSFRLPGVFGYPTVPEYETTRTILNGGEQPYVEDDMSEVFILNLKAIPYFVHKILKTDFMMPDTCSMITDYCGNNNANWVKKRVVRKSGYEPRWNILKTLLAPIDLKFNAYFNNNKKFRN